MPLLGAAALAVYGAVLANEVPRVTGASSGVRSACAYVGLGFVALAVALVILYDFLAGPGEADSDRTGRGHAGRIRGGA